MTSGVIANLIARLPEPGGYISIWKPLALIVALGLWAAFGQWVNTDSQQVRMKRSLWNGIIMASGTAGLLAWLLMPLAGHLFFLGFVIWALIAGGAAAVYVVYRNGLVPNSRRVFTKAHILSKIGGGRRKQKRAEAFEKVKLTDGHGKTVKVPEDDEEIAAFCATQDLLFDALWRRATQVDMVVGAETARLAYRIDGIVAERKDLIDHKRAELAFRFIKRIAGLDVEDRRRPQQGKISAQFAGSIDTNAKIEVRTSGSTAGERLQLGVLSEESQFHLPNLGFAPQRLARFTELVELPQGMIIVSGIPQSGLTSTLYAALRSHDAYQQHIHALERKPPLYELENITQHRYDEATSKISYARQLQSIIRREPNVVMIDHCADQDTARLTTNAALKGLKIYIQIHAKDSVLALHQMMQLVENHGDFAQALLCVTNQRLVRKLCTSCREAYKPDPALLKKVNLPAEKIEHFFRPPSQQIVDKKGNPIICSDCQGTGYVGRAAVFELLVIDDAFRKVIKANADVPVLKAQARKNRTLYLQEEGLLKVMDGVTSMNEIIRGLRDDAES
jgi:type II secretory ATPase GspE/PulE/Tfp pilus assembly ATPase PilB-like protein